jgi:hypothetical protein
MSLAPKSRDPSEENEFKGVCAEWFPLPCTVEEMDGMLLLWCNGIHVSQPE